MSVPSNGDSSSPVQLFHGLGRLHRALAEIRRLSTRDLRRSFVTGGTLRRWVTANADEGLVPIATAKRIRRQIRRFESRWVSANDLPIQLIHADPHAGNIIGAGEDTVVYLDFSGVETAPRVHDLAIALTYQLVAGSVTIDGLQGDALPQLLNAYSTGAGVRLTEHELAALFVYAAAITLYYDICGWAEDWRFIGEKLLDLPSPTLP